MLKRCPDSRYEGIARLKGYRWIINSRGYANVVETSDDKDGDVVWGLVYSLSSSDEENLDRNEGVPEAYTKEVMVVDFWPATSSNSGSCRGGKPDVQADPEERTMLVYIDRKRTQPDSPKREYVYRMNMGIRDAVAEGVPGFYVEGVMRKFIPPEGDGDGDGSVEGLAGRQAVEFVDE